MEHWHDIATTIGNSATISIFCGLAAGLAAVSLLAGVPRLRKDDLPSDFPADAEALASKYALAFQQLDEARRENPQGLKKIIDGLRGQTAPIVCLTAFDEYLEGQREDASKDKAGTKAKSTKTDGMKTAGTKTAGKDKAGKNAVSTKEARAEEIKNNAGKLASRPSIMPPSEKIETPRANPPHFNRPGLGKPNIGKPNIGQADIDNPNSDKGSGEQPGRQGDKR